MQRQPNSRMCFCCGRDNPIGLHLTFETDGERVYTQFTAQEFHQGYPGVLHGGIAYAILDETLGRAALARELWVVTARMEVRYRQPIPLGVSLAAMGEILEVKRRLATGRAEIRLPDGSVAAEATGTFVEAAAEVQAQWQDEAQFWQVDEEVKHPPI